MIIINIDVMLARRKMSVTELSNRVGITMANISILKTARLRPFASRRSTRSAARSTASRATSWNTGRTRRLRRDARGTPGGRCPVPRFKSSI